MILLKMVKPFRILTQLHIKGFGICFNCLYANKEERIWNKSLDGIKKVFTEYYEKISQQYKNDTKEMILYATCDMVKRINENNEVNDNIQQILIEFDNFRKVYPVL